MSVAADEMVGVEILGAMGPRYDEVLGDGALAFLSELHRAFNGRRTALLAARAARQKAIDAGALPDFLPETAHIREGEWRVAPIPADLLDRRVEITGPCDRKMIVNALNSGAKVFMADFEDASSPTWANMMEGQVNMIDRWAGRIDFTDERGRDYKLSATPAVLMMRPRGWHLPEAHLRVDGEEMSGALVDFGLYFYHNAKNQIAQGTGPYFYLPKIESHQEAALWDSVFVHAQDALGIPHGTIRATVLIETLPAAFEMNEILYELRDHIAGLNCGRWDYIFSFIKTLQAKPEFILPDRSQLVMSRAFLHAYSLLLIKTCHRRGAFAMGGMAAQVPNRRDESANAVSFGKVRADKEREAGDGHDGTWVAHPDLVPVAMEIFDRLMQGPNQLSRQRDDVSIDQAQLLEVHEGERTEAGVRDCIRVGIRYIEAWLRGRGAVPLYNLMEDAATAEISRSQLWQWIKYGATLSDGQTVDVELFERCLAEEMDRVRGEVGEDAFTLGRFEEAIGLFRELSTAATLATFLTLPAYRML